MKRVVAFCEFCLYMLDAAVMFSICVALTYGIVR